MSNVVICKHSPNGQHMFTTTSRCDYCGLGGIILDGTPLYVETDKGQEYHRREEPNVLLWGGRGSGKSTIGRWDAHMRALMHPGFSYVVLRRTYPELQKSHLIHIGREMKQLGGSFHHTDRVALYPNGSKGFFSHCANDDDVLNLLSAEFALAFFDELSTFEWEMFTKLSASVRVPVGSGLTAMVRAATNPLGPSAMKILEYFVDHNVDPEEDPDYNPSDWYSIHANLIDNPHLDQVQYRKRFSGLPSHVRKAWVDGEFVLENALFDLETTRNGKPYHIIHDIDLEKVIKSATIYRAIDAGWFPDPTVVLWIAHLGNRHIVFNEKIWYKTTAIDIAADIHEEDKRLGVKKVAITYCDPSMDINTTADIRTVKEIYEANGISMENSINNREMFATAMHNALAEEAGEDLPRLQIYNHGHDGCPYLSRTIPQMRFDQKRPKAMADHKNDHAVVALCYYLMSHSSLVHSEPSSGTPLRPWMKPKDNKRFVLGSDQVR
jgi:phage terminase large subunit